MRAKRSTRDATSCPFALRVDCSKRASTAAGAAAECSNMKRIAAAREFAPWSPPRCDSKTCIYLCVLHIQVLAMLVRFFYPVRAAYLRPPTPPPSQRSAICRQRRMCYWNAQLVPEYCWFLVASDFPPAVPPAVLGAQEGRRGASKGRSLGFGALVS